MSGSSAETANTELLRSHRWEHTVAVTGALGSGKTEFAMSLAKAFAAAGEHIHLADMDIINPYFCLRTMTKEMEDENISLVMPRKELTWGDFRCVNPDVRAKLSDKGSRLVLDIGGDAQGAFALKQFESEIEDGGYELLFVINPYRTHTRTYKEVAAMRDELEKIGGLRISAVVANPHFMNDTEPSDCARGILTVSGFAEKLGLPLLFGIAHEKLAAEARRLLEERVPVWELKRRILLPWERQTSD